MKRKTPDRNDLKLDLAVVLCTMSKPINLMFKRSRAQGPLACMYMDSCRTHDVQP